MTSPGWCPTAASRIVWALSWHKTIGQPVQRLRVPETVACPLLSRLNHSQSQTDQHCGSIGGSPTCHAVARLHGLVLVYGRLTLLSAGPQHRPQREPPDETGDVTLRAMPRLATMPDIREIPDRAVRSMAHEAQWNTRFHSCESLSTSQLSRLPPVSRLLISVAPPGVLTTPCII